MYIKRHKKSKKKVIQGVECWIPPVGWVWDYHPQGQRMIKTGVYSRSNKKAEQYWEIPHDPSWYKDRRRKERIKQKTDPEYQDPEVSEYANTEWFRRLNGFWFMNNGTPTYITGLHYFYIAHWHIDIGLPSFYWADLLYFYFLASAFEDPRCGGIVNYANRRSGKTYRAGCTLYEVISRTMGVMGGIQSKNDKDAKKVFTKHVVMPFRKLPDFFVPNYDRESGLSPKNILRFFATNVRGKAAADSLDEPALDSEIDYREASSKAYDGTKLKIVLEDEFGKLDAEHSVLERHRTVKYCVMVGGEFVGKMLYSTTVEDMSSGKNIEESKQMFIDSDPEHRLSNGQTVSSLYRFRLPAYETYMYDKYGMPRSEEARAELQAITQELLRRGDYVAYASEKRKQPFDDDDIFRVSAKSPVWDIIKISDTLASLSWKDPDEIYVRGNFAWVDGVRDTRVKFVPMKTGRFLLCQQMENEPQNLRRPINKHRFGAGCDPFEQKVAQKPSNGTAYVIKKAHPEFPELANSPIVEYCARPLPSIFFEDMIKMVVYFGCEILVENNKIGLITHMEKRGYGAFLKRYPGSKTAGIFASEKSKELGAERVADYVENFCHLIPFTGLLNDMVMFDLANSTKFDRSMAFMWTVYLVMDSLLEPDTNAAETMEVTKVVRSYKIKR